MSETDINIDPQEVAKFDALAARWWDPDSEFKPLHDINPLRLAYIEDRVPLAGKQVLDVGCGGGILSESMAARGAQVTGIDMAGEALTIARLHQHESGITVDYQQATAEQWARQHAGGYDIVTCMELLEHVPDPATLVQACARLVKPGGRLFLSTINRNPRSYLFAIIGAEYLLRLLPKGTHDYAKFIRPSELGHWLRQAGMELTDLTGLSYDPLARRYSLGHDVTVNYLCYAVHRD